MERCVDDYTVLATQLTVFGIGRDVALSRKGL